MNILIADNDNSVHQAVSLQLQKQGHTIFNLRCIPGRVSRRMQPIKSHQMATGFGLTQPISDPRLFWKPSTISTSRRRVQALKAIPS